MLNRFYFPPCVSFFSSLLSKWLFDWRDWSDETNEPLFQFDSQVNPKKGEKTKDLGNELDE